MRNVDFQKQICKVCEVAATFIQEWEIRLPPGSLASFRSTDGATNFGSCLALAGNFVLTIQP